MKNTGLILISLFMGLLPILSGEPYLGDLIKDPLRCSECEIELEVYRHPKQTLYRMPESRNLSNNEAHDLFQLMLSLPFDDCFGEEELIDRPILKEYKPSIKLWLKFDSGRKELYSISFSKDLKWVSISANIEATSSSSLRVLYDEDNKLAKFLGVEKQLERGFFSTMLFQYGTLIIVVIVLGYWGAHKLWRVFKISRTRSSTQIKL